MCDKSEIGKTLKYCAGDILYDEGVIVNVYRDKDGLLIREIQEEGAKITSHIYESEIISIT